jgi:ATP-dependent helicase HrpB
MRTTVRYLDLVLSEDANAPVDPHDAGPILFAAIREKAREIFEANESAARWLNRVAFLRRFMPEHPWPAFDDRELGQALEELCQNRRSLEEIERLPLANMLEARLGYPLDQVLRTEAPETPEVPTGNRIQLDYGRGDAPILAVRLQEVFSWRDTPRVAGGRVPVLLHLLGPNYRPVQITGDLRGFWAGTYFQVRKDLRARYPKHSWPEDPLTALPVAKGRPKRA